MKTRIACSAVLVALATLFAALGTGGSPVEGPKSDAFAVRARKDIEALCGIGPRPAGSPNEGRAAAYIADRFLAAGMIPAIEPFSFETFEPDEITLRIGDQAFTPVGLGFDPYSEKGRDPYSGEFLLLDPGAPADWPPSENITGKAVVTSEAGFASTHFRIAAMMPRYIIYVSQRDFALLREPGNRKLLLSCRGSYVEGMSRNVVARLGSPPPAPQIIVGAHLDAYRDAPGANDNASGIAALLEIVRDLKSLTVPQGIGLMFVAFGAEEAGILGSRHFVERHAKELKSCLLTLILDNLGGEGPVSIERNGGRLDPPEVIGGTRFPAVYQGRSWEGLRYRWKLVPPPDLYAAIGTPYHPAWLMDAIDGTAKALNFEVRFTGLQGSDEMAFAQAGVATVGICAPNSRQHTLDDSPEAVDYRKVRQCKEAALGIIQKAWDQRPPTVIRRVASEKRDDPMAPVRFLASDELGGRQAGSREGEIAADYIRECLRAAGVEPFPGLPDYFQDVTLPGLSPSPYRAPNVVGFIRGRDAQRADEFVLLVAHYDHLGRKSENGLEVIYNGARDNAMGVAALLSAAKALASNPPARSILILVATAEEEGLIGSHFFVEHPPIPLQRIVSVLNNDGAGVTQPGLWCIGGLDTSSVRPEVEAAGREFGLTTRPYPERYRFLFAKGDSASFVDKGIPSLTVSPGFSEDDVKRIEKYIHTPTDRVDTGFDEDYLRKFCYAFASLARRVADSEGPARNSGK